MLVTNIKIKLCLPQSGRLKAYCALTFDNTFVVRDIKLIEGNDGVFLAMPSRKVMDHCGRCGEKNHLRARYCNNCGGRLDENRTARQHPEHASHHGHSNGHSMHDDSHSHCSRIKLHADIAHPISAGCRHNIEQQVMAAFAAELQRSRLPGYVPTSLDGEDGDYYEAAIPVESALPVSAIH